MLLAVGVFAIEWTAIFGQRTVDFLENVNLDTLWSLRDYLDPHLWLPLTIVIAFFHGVSARIPTKRRRRSHSEWEVLAHRERPLEWPLERPVGAAIAPF